MANKQTKAVKKAKGKRVNKKHFIIYNNGGVVSTTTPKDWARGHQTLFPNYNFINRTPTVAVIESYLAANGFTEVYNKEIVIFYQYYSL